MEDLSKQQLVLLAILISFVTSLATGIVTVSLMDQAPSGVTRTITQVIQQTVADAVPASGATSTASVSIAVNDQVADAVAAVTPSIVRLRDGDTGAVVGLGLIVSARGTVVADKNILTDMNDPEALTSDGTVISMAVTRFQIQGDAAFLAPMHALAVPLKAVTIGDAARLGASIWSLTGTTTYALSQGIVSELDPVASSTSSSTPSAVSIIRTTVRGDRTISGAPLFDATGAVIGIETTSLAGETASFYPIQALENAVPK
jgi:S1-C subfamily serine protease